jgi:glutamate-1-semialdehyde 2,1-aminomutase
MKKHFSLNKSCKLYAKALKYLPAGVNSNARLWRNPRFCYVGPGATASIFIKRAYGSHIWDVDDNEYVDYRLGFGPVILGHSYPAVEKAVIKQSQNNGTIYGMNSELELEVAEKFVRAVPCAETARFSSSGTEATLHAIRLARAYTNKKVILKFEGHYHGWQDYLLFSAHPPYTWPERKPYFHSAGVPKEIEKFILVERWNDFESIEKTVRAHHKEIAAIITEPIMGNSGGITPLPGYLKFLRELCDRYDILLIFDEVKTGFRIAFGGAQELYKVEPHIATYAKALGNGYVISAVTGERDIMNFFGVGPGKVTHSGTYNANPVSLAAANATLDELSNKIVYKHLQSYNKRLIDGIKKIGSEAGLPLQILGVSGMFQIFYDRRPIHNYVDLRNSIKEFYVKVQYELLREGVMIDADNQECIYTSYSHNEKDLKKTLDAFKNAIEKASKTEYHVTPFSQIAD